MMFCKIFSHRLTDYDVISHDLHVIVTIRPGVFVPEADHMSKLVHDNAKLVAVFAYGYRLRTVATFAHERTASERREGKMNTNINHRSIMRTILTGII